MASLFQKATKAATVYGQIAPYVRSVGDVLGLTGSDPLAPFLGGYTVQQVRDMMAAINGNGLARRNLFAVHVAGPQLSAEELGLDITDTEIFDSFHLLAQEVSYTPYTIAGEKHKVGSIVLDGPNGTEHVDLTLTTMDDEIGTIKRWFRALYGKIANSDGTFGLPVDYEVKIQVTHAVAAEGSVKWEEAYKDVLRMRPAQMPLELSRADGAQPQLIGLQFTQMDTHIGVSPWR